MSTTRRLDPSTISPEEARQLDRLLSSPVRPRLLSPGGDAVELPEPINDFFYRILEAIRRQEIVYVASENEAFTTQAAANFLGVSRQFLIRLLDDKKILFHRVGTHRRIFFRDLLTFKEARSKDRREKLDRMTDLAIEAGADEKYVDLTREGRE